MPNSLDRRLTHQKSVDSATAAATAASKILSSSENKPSLPVKRSKSMKVISKPVSFLFGNTQPAPEADSASTANNNKQLVKSQSVVEGSELR
jgi:hypothetical protein